MNYHFKARCACGAVKDNRATHCQACWLRNKRNDIRVVNSILTLNLHGVTTREIARIIGLGKSRVHKILKALPSYTPFKKLRTHPLTPVLWSRWSARRSVEKRLGRKLGGKEHVHHIDHNPFNNSPDNLQVLSASAHQRLHMLERWRKKREASNSF